MKPLKGLSGTADKVQSRGFRGMVKSTKECEVTSLYGKYGKVRSPPYYAVLLYPCLI